MINSGWDVNTVVDKYGETAINRAALRGNITVLKALVEKGVNFNSALERAVSGKNSEAAKILLDAGADPNRKSDGNNNTILMNAITGLDIQFAKLLIEYCKDLQVGNSYHTPLSLAQLKVKQGKSEMQTVVDLIKSKLQNN